MLGIVNHNLSKCSAYNTRITSKKSHKTLLGGGRERERERERERDRYAFECQLFLFVFSGVCVLYVL
jgi:hypothetical protein